MPQMVPELTIQMWTALSILRELSPLSTVFTKTHESSLPVWSPAIRQWFVVASVVPESAPPTRSVLDPSAPCYSINRRQLTYLADAYAERQQPDVIYLLPDPRDRPRLQGRDAYVPLWHPKAWRTFSEWTYAIRARALRDLVDTADQAELARVRWDSDFGSRNLNGDEPQGTRTLSYQSHPTKKRRFARAMKLQALLKEMRRGEEPPGMTMRSPQLTPANHLYRRDRDEEHDDLPYAKETVREARRVLNQRQAGNLLHFGILWEQDDPLRQREDSS